MAAHSQQTAVVTGSGGGIGRAVALRLARGGARVLVTDLDAQATEETTDLIVRSGGKATGVPADITSPRELEHLFEAAISAYGVPNILVNNAGWTSVVPFLDTARILEPGSQHQPARPD